MLKFALPFFILLVIVTPSLTSAQENDLADLSALKGDVVGLKAVINEIERKLDNLIIQKKVAARVSAKISTQPPLPMESTSQTIATPSVVSYSPIPVAPQQITYTLASPVMTPSLSFNSLTGGSISEIVQVTAPVYTQSRFVQTSPVQQRQVWSQRRLPRLGRGIRFVQRAQTPVQMVRSNST